MLVRTHNIKSSPFASSFHGVMDSSDVADSADIRLAECLELSDKIFIYLIKGVESHPLFKQLYEPLHEEERIVSRKSFFQTRLSPVFYKFVKSLYGSNKYVLNIKKIIQVLGYERFEYFFLYNESHLSSAQIAANCGLGITEVMEMQRYLDHLYVPSGKIGEVKCEKYLTPSGNEDERLILFVYSPAFARGAYAINYQRLALMSKQLSTEDMRTLKRIVRTLEIINLRMVIVHKLICRLLMHQKEFCLSGDTHLRVPLRQVEIARELQLDTSIICRAIRKRSIVVNRRTMALKDFLPSRKQVVLRMLHDIIQQEKRVATDEMLRKKLFAQYRINVSRRSISMYRKQMEIPSSFNRDKG